MIEAAKVECTAADHEEMEESYSAARKPSIRSKS